MKTSAGGWLHELHQRAVRSAPHLCWLMVAACVTQSAGPPAVAPSSTLRPALSVEAEGTASPFALAFAGPRGPTPANAQINLVFNKPLRALDAEQRPPQLPITLAPSVSGQWQWVGSHAVAFVPAGGQFPPATRVTVTVPAALRASNGETLGKTTQWTFETPLPRVETSDPSNEQKDVGVRQPILLSFNQPVAPSEVQRLAQLTVPGTTPRRIAFTAQRPKLDKPNEVALIPTAPLPKASSIALRLPAGLRGEGGPLPSEGDFWIGFYTPGPMQVIKLGCGHGAEGQKCSPGDAPDLTFSNPARFGDIKRAIQIQPPVPLDWADWWDDNESVRWVSLVGRFEPEQTYRVSVSSQLSDDYGQGLQPSAPLTFTVGSFDPQVELGIEGTVIPSAGAPRFEIGSVNTPRFELLSAVLDAGAALDITRDPRDPFSTLAGVPGLKTQTLRSGPHNQMTRHPINLLDHLGKSGGYGLVGIGIRHHDASGRERTDIRLLNVTNLGLTAKVSRFGSLVWVTELNTGKPAANAEVELVGKYPVIARRYRADASGLVEIPATDFAPIFEHYPSTDDDTLLIARLGSDWTYHRLKDMISPWSLDVPADLSRKVEEYGMLFTERGLYRPGDTLQVKGILREESRAGNRIPDSRSFTLALTSPSGAEVATSTVQLSEYGSFATTFAVPRTAELGSWHITTKKLGDGQATTRFRVAEYRPAEFKVAVAAQHNSVLREDEAQFEVTGDYLFGAPMANAEVSYSMTRERAWFAPPGSEGFVVDDGAYQRDRDQRSMDGSVLEQQSGKLDARGKLAIRRKLTLADQTGPERVFVEAEVKDLSRQGQAGSTAVLVHPASFYIGLQTAQDWFVSVPGQFVPRVVAFAPDGRRVAGKRVEIKLIRRRWTVVREQTADGVQTRSQLVEEPVSQCSLVSGEQPVSCPLPLREGGYYVVLAKSKDEQGRTAQSAQELYAIGAGRASWADDSAQRLELTLNKKQYRVGDVARVLVKSPYPVAEALVTVERAGVQHFETVQLRGSTPTIDVPITAEMEPNAFVGVHLLKSAAPLSPEASAAKRTVSAPAFRIGYAEIRVDPEARRLAVQVTANHKEFRPGADVQVALQVRDKKGQGHPAEVTFFAVDEGVLSLIGYKTPDPLPIFTAPRPLQVATLETRDDLAKIGLRDLTQLLGSNKGSEGGGGGDARKDFRQSAYFNPSVITDAQGRASLAFKLPDSLTTYRLMAVAISKDDRYGFGESQVTTNKQLMLRPALPRFLRAGDRFQASLIVSAKGMKPGPVSVSADVSGVTLDGSSTRVIELDSEGSAEVRFPATAHAIGKIRFRFTAKALGTTDSVEVTRETYSPAKEETVALYGQTTTAQAEALGDFSALRPDQGGLAITLASTALVGLDASIEQLVEFPYACTEQLASRTLPLLPLSALTKRYGLKLPERADVLAQNALAEILKRQRGDGGFGLWPDSDTSHPWASSYALWVLHLARATGKASLSPAVFQRGRDYLRGGMRRLHAKQISPAEAAFMVMVLAELGDFSYLNALFEQRATLPLFARALLLRAAVLAKAPAEIGSTLQRDLEAHIAFDGNRAVLQREPRDDEVMSSPIRTHAMVLWALLAANPKHELAPALARSLLLARQHGTWRNTQETAFSLVALAAYAVQQEKEPPSFLGRIWLGKRELWHANFESDSPLSAATWIPMGKLAGGKANLVFQTEGNGTLYYEARLRYASKALPTSDLDRGFFIRRTLRSVAPASLTSAQAIVPEVGVTTFKGGDLVLADIVVVTATARRFVVIEDPLPAGLEAIDTQLNTTARSLDTSQTSSHSAYQDAWYQSELRDDRALFFVDDMPAGMYHYRFLARATTLGQFIVPAAQVSEMYQPEVFGRTAATQVEVH